MIITAWDRTQTLHEWAEETGINPHTIRSRIMLYNFSPEKALTRGSKKEEDGD